MLAAGRRLGVTGIDTGSPAGVMGRTWSLLGSCIALLNPRRGAVMPVLIGIHLCRTVLAHPTAPCLRQVISLSWRATRERQAEARWEGRHSSARLSTGFWEEVVARKASGPEIPAQGDCPTVPFVYCVNTHVCVCTCTHMGHGTYVDVRRQLAELNSLPSSGGGD